MVSSKIVSYITTGTAAAASLSNNNNNNNNRAYAFYPFTSSSNSTPKDDQTSSDYASSITKSDASADEPRGAGMDPELLERGAKALRNINSSPNSKMVFELMRHQEKSRQAELAAEKVHHEAVQSQLDIEKQRKRGEEHRELVQKQSLAKAQHMRYEDELARKRMQTDHEAQRRHNVELVKMQEESSIRKEKARRVTEEQIQAQKRQTEKERAEIERETLRHNAIAEAEARAHEAKLTEDQNRRLLVEQMNGEKDKWLAAINTTFGHIEGGIRMLLTDRRKLIMTIGGATALAAGFYTSREGARVTWGYINRILGQPSLIRESSMAKYPLSATVSRAMNTLKFSTKAGPVSDLKSSLGNVILHPSLQKRIEHLARATANTKSHQAPFRNMLFYGPPGTGKTMVAREIARKSGLDYAMMTGGDVAPLGPQAVTKIHEIFDWAKKSKKGLLLFIDEADAFLCERNSIYMSEAQRSALNALLFRTGDQSRDIVLVLATNRPEDLDGAITDRIDEVLEFPIPGEEERFKLIKLYLNKYLVNQTNTSSSGLLFKNQPQSITIKDDVSDDLIREAARKIDGFSGREIAKLMASVQAAVYGRPDCVLDSQLFMEVVDYKIVEHHQRIKLAAEGGQPQPI